MEKYTSHKIHKGTGNTASTGGGRTQGVSKFLQGRDSDDSILWVGYVVTFCVNGKEGRGETQVVPATDHGEAREAIWIQDMGDAGSGRRIRGSGNPVGEGLYRATAGGWRYVPHLRCVQGREGTKEGGAGWRRGGAKRRQKKIRDTLVASQEAKWRRRINGDMGMQ